MPVRLIVQRVKPTPGYQLALFTSYSCYTFITDQDGDTLDLEGDHLRHAEIENAIRHLKYGVRLNHLPSGRFPVNAAGLSIACPALDARHARSSPINWPVGQRASAWVDGRHHQDPPATLLLPSRTPHPQGPPPHPASPPGLALAKSFRHRPGEIARPATLFLTPPSAFGLSTIPPRLADPPPGWCPDGLCLRSTLKIAQPHHRRLTSPWRGSHTPDRPSH